MRPFKDSPGNGWQIVLTIDIIKRVKGLINVDLSKPHLPRTGQEAALIDELETDFVLFAEVVLALVRAQAETMEIDEKEFMSALDGTAIGAARAAFRGELADFLKPARGGRDAEETGGAERSRGGGDRGDERGGGDQEDEDCWDLVDDLAGIVGVVPGPLTLRSLIRMAEAPQRADWARTSSLMSLIANLDRDPKKRRPFSASDFDPFHARRAGRRPTGKITATELEQILGAK